MGKTCVKGAYCMHDGERSRCVCPSQFTENKCNYEDTCIGTTCGNGEYCMHDDEDISRCVCPNQLTETECQYEGGIPPDNFNRMTSFKTANKTNDLTLLNIKKCVQEEIVFFKLKVKSSGNINITMISSNIDKQVVTIEIVINKKYISVIYVEIDENGENKTIIDNIRVSCNTCSNLAVNWRGGILKFGTMFDDNLVKPVFTGIFKVRDIHLSSDADADWVLNFFESDGPNYAKVEIFLNGVSQTLLMCQVFQNCYNTLSGEIVPVLFGEGSSKCSEEPKIQTSCINNGNGAELSYLCLNQNQQTNEGCKDILRISACKGETKTCDHCKYHNIEMDIKTLCVNKTERLILISIIRCENLHNLLTIWHEIHDNILTESDMNYNQETQKSEIVGLAVGISASVIVIIVIACVLIFLRRKKSSSKKESTQTSSNGQDYIGNQNIAMPWPGDSPEYTDMKVRRESHKYGELKSVNEATGDSCYDVIDANEHAREIKVFSVEQVIFQNESSSIPCQDYAMLDPNKKWNTEPNTSPYRDTGCDDYTVLEAEEANDNHPVNPPSDQLDKSPRTHQTKNIETKMEGKSTNNAKRDNYIVLDPKLTGFNRMNDTGNDEFDPRIRDMEHDTTHPVKENTNCYELAKPVLEDGKENTCHKYDGDYGSCQDSDYQINGGHPTYSEEHVYNHTVDDVYDTTSHNKKSTVPDNTYDYFSGNQTDDDYNIPMKM